MYITPTYTTHNKGYTKHAVWRRVQQLQRALLCERVPDDDQSDVVLQLLQDGHHSTAVIVPNHDIIHLVVVGSEKEGGKTFQSHFQQGMIIITCIIILYNYISTVITFIMRSKGCSSPFCSANPPAWMLFTYTPGSPNPSDRLNPKSAWLLSLWRWIT